MSTLYTISPAKGIIRFHIRPADIPLLPVYIAGSFTDWQRLPVSEWQLLPEENGGRLVLDRNLDEVLIPGNCGYPEYTFFTIDKSGDVQPLALDGGSDGRHEFLGNYALLQQGDDLTLFMHEAEKASRIKTLPDFMPLTDENRAIVANFRKIPGSSCVYRSYHPYKKSFPGFDTEEIRSLTVKLLLEEKKIASIICLSGDEPADSLRGETICVYQQQLIAAGNEYYTDTSYETAYYHSGNSKFIALFCGILRFIAAHSGPYLVHCRLGSDRTGVVSALLALLCGAVWPDVAADYEKTSSMGILQYRDRRLLRYSLEHFAEVSLSDTVIYASAIAARCVSSGCITSAELEKAVERMSC
jgi:hypothetical protein